MAKQTQLFFDNQWFPIADGFEAFKAAKDGGFPIRILHDTGSFKVIHNVDKLPKDVEARHKA